VRRGLRPSHPQDAPTPSGSPAVPSSPSRDPVWNSYTFLHDLRHTFVPEPEPLLELLAVAVSRLRGALGLAPRKAPT